MYPGAHVEKQGDKLALIMTKSGFTQTFAELDAAANQLSRVLRASGLKAGDHVVICMENHDRYLEVTWGCHYAGLVYTTASYRLLQRELEHIINDSGARALIMSAYKAPLAASLLDSAPNLDVRLMLDGVIDGFESYEAAVAEHSPLPLDEARIAGSSMLYSSGTTGLPKGVKNTFESQPLETFVMRTLPFLQGVFGFDIEARYLSPAPLYHAAPLGFCMAVQAMGATAVVMEDFEASEFLELIERYSVTHTQTVPTMLIRMLKLPEDVRSKWDLSSLKVLIHAAAPCPPTVKKQIIDWFGPIVHEYYSGTEGSGMVYCNTEMWLSHEGTVGAPVGCVVHIVDDEGNEVETGQAGTIYFEGFGDFEYHNDPEKTKGAYHPKGWSTLGDVGYLDSDGFLYLTDRKAYMIISGGVNIYPQEAENVLVNHPRVIDVAVFGVPCEEFGEKVKAVVQPDVMPTTLEEATAFEKDLIAYCRSEIADVKCPRSVDFREELPRHPTGKLYKRLLKDEYWLPDAQPPKF